MFFVCVTPKNNKINGKIVMTENLWSQFFWVMKYINFSFFSNTKKQIPFQWILMKVILIMKMKKIILMDDWGSRNWRKRDTADVIILNKYFWVFKLSVYLFLLDLNPWNELKIKKNIIWMSSLSKSSSLTARYR